MISFAVRSLLPIVFAAVLLNAADVARAEGASESFWSEARKGRVAILIRHALAPGTGDPANFSIGDCATQRNLNETGRAQARRIGALLRARDIRPAAVYSSQWCRCLETARLLGAGTVIPLPAANSFFANRDTGPAQTKELRRFIAANAGQGVIVIVTHQVNITALTDVFPASGELIAVRADAAGRLRVVGRLPTR